MTFEQERGRAVRRVILVALLANVVQAGGKLAWGYLSGSLGLVADGYHSSLDGLASVLGLVGVTLAAAPPDAEHQYGHRKIEVLSSMGISLFIFAGAYQVVREAWDRLSGTDGRPQVTWVSFAVMTGSLLIGIGVSRYEGRRARELKSSVLSSDAAHTWSDVGASLAVILGLAATRFVHPLADVVVAGLVALLILRIGYQTLLRGLQVVSDRAVLDAAAVERIAREHQGVRGTARIRSRGEADHAFLDLVLLVEPGLTVAQAHELVDRIEERLRREIPGIADIVTHVEPG